MKMTKTKPCPICGVGKIMTDELHREFNGKVDGKVACPACVADDMIAKIMQTKRLVGHTQ